MSVKSNAANRGDINTLTMDAAFTLNAVARGLGL
jgi:hypothetical protein